MQNRQRAAMSTVVVGGLPVLLVFLFWLKAIEMKLLRWGFIGCGEVTEKNPVQHLTRSQVPRWWL